MNNKTGMPYLYFLLAIFIFSSVNTQAANVDTVETYSASMKKMIKAVVITPDGYKKNIKYPVVYLLHGFGGNYAGYVNEFPMVKEAADKYNIIIVSADGQHSWYFDSPMDSSLKYDTYVAKELVGWVDSHYSTITNKYGRGIAGLSMGGHGALYLAFKHKDIFGAAGSMSGGVDIRPFPGNWDIAKTLGTIEAQPSNWENYTVTNMIALIKTDWSAMLIDCGTDDFFYKVNVEFHNKLLENKIPHDFVAREGAHELGYWLNSINYQFLFMHLFFDKHKVEQK